MLVGETPLRHTGTCGTPAAFAPAVLQGLLVYDEIFDGRFTHTLQAAGGTYCDLIDNAIIHHPKSGMPSLIQHH
jgi:hypothetical protein